jgi:hypothetical protein
MFNHEPISVMDFWHVEAWVMNPETALSGPSPVWRTHGARSPLA